MKAGIMVKAISAFVSLALATGRRDSFVPRGTRAKSTDFQVIEELWHDPNSFTQGLVFENGLFWEGTGLYGNSKLLKLNATTGQVLAEQPLSEDYFGEGIVKVGDNIIQLTWRERTGFVYRASDLKPVSEFKFRTLKNEGWGITFDGNELIVSDGSPYLYFWDPTTFRETRRIRVSDGRGQAISMLNELEFVNGHIWANVWLSDDIIKIDPLSGKVVTFFDFSTLFPLSERLNTDQVLNGIAYDEANQLFYLTGKNWPKMYKVSIPSERSLGKSRRRQ